MVSNVAFSGAPHRTIPKFGEAAHTHTSEAPKPEHHESAFMIEVDLKGKEAAKAATSPAEKTKALAKPAVRNLHAAASEIPAIILKALAGVVAAYVALEASKRLMPSAAGQSFEQKLKEAKLTERAKEAGKIQSKLIGISPLLLIAGGFLTKMGEKAGEKLIEIPTSFIPKPKPQP
jgi:hypothetical protein